MNTYQCKECKGYQYSASETKEDEPCVYCGAEIRIVKDERLEEVNANDKKGIA